MVVRIHPDAKVFFDGYLGVIGINRKNQNKIKTKGKDEQFLIWLANEGVFSSDIKNINKDYFKELLKNGFLEIDKKQGRENFENERKIFENHMKNLPKNRSVNPLLISVCITNRCNLRCKHCGNNSSSDSDVSLKFEEIKNIIDQAEKLNTMKLTLTGGEPLLHEKIFDIIEYTFNKIPRLGLTTNGYVLSKEIVQKIKNKVDVVKISLDGLEIFHDSFRNKNGSYDRCIKAIKLLLEEKIETRVQITLVKGNENDIKKLVLILNTLGVKRISIVPLTPIGRAKKEMMLNPKEYEKFLLKTLQFLKKIKLKSEVELRPLFTLMGKDLMRYPKIIGNKYHCEALRSSFDILPNGDVIPCSFLHQPIGNIRKNTLKEIWESKEADKLREFMDKVKNNSKCRVCEFGRICAGGCFANHFGIYKKIGRDVYCWR